MADSPVPIARQSENELSNQSPDLQVSSAIDEESISDKPDLQILFNSTDDRTSSIASHIDENNENDAVRISERFDCSLEIFDDCFRLKHL